MSTHKNPIFKLSHMVYGYRHSFTLDALRFPLLHKVHKTSISKGQKKTLQEDDFFGRIIA
jgi:hypothetical protein